MSEEKNPNFTFRLSSPQARRMLNFIADYERTTPGKVLNRLIHERIFELIDQYASKMAHEKLSMQFAADFDIEIVAWVNGSRMDHWQRFSNSISPELALKYQEAFLPIWDLYCTEIDKTAGSDYFDYERRCELENDTGGKVSFL